MEIFVTGGSGFIGRHLCRRLAGEGHEVTDFDLSDPKIEGVVFSRGSVMEPRTIPDLSKYGAVFHLAAIVGVANVEKDPVTTLDVNIGGVRNVLEAASKAGVKKFFFPSSSEVYGEPLKNPISETDPFNPVSAYGVSKIVGEEYVKSFAKTRGFEYNIYRFFSSYGAGQRTDFVIPRFVDLALKGEPLTVHGDGKQVRAFCHIDDIVEAMILGIEKTMDDVFNLGNDKEPVTMGDLAEIVVEETGSKSKIVSVSEAESGRGRKRDVYNRIPDTSKAKKELGFEAKVPLREGIKKVVDSIRGR